MDEYDYLKELTFRVDLSNDCDSNFNAMVIESLVAGGVLVQVVLKQRTWRTLFGATEWIGKKIGIR